MRTASRLAALLLCLLHVPASGQEPAAWRLVPDLRIGSLDEPNYSFTPIWDVEAGANGRIFVAQSSERTIRVFDDKGKYLYSIGRKGAGPGEFQSVHDLHHSPSGLLVVDGAQRRLSLFTMDGRFLDSWGRLPQRLEPHLVPGPPEVLLRDGTLIVIPGSSLRHEPPVKEVPLIAIDTAESQFRVLAKLNVENKTRRVTSADFSAVVPQPVSSSTLYAFPREMNGVILVHRTIGDSDNAGEIHVVHLTSAGDTVLSKRYRIPAVEISASAVQDSLQRAIQRAIKRTSFPREHIVAMFTDAWRLPPYQAPVDHVIAGVDGTIWLRRGAFGLAVGTWWVLDARGNIIATLRIPAGLILHRVSADRVWATQHGEYDEPYVVRMRVVRP